MGAEAQAHVINKINLTEHYSVPITVSLPSLKDGHLRARTAVTSLTANNLSYAILGTALKWWDTYPVSSEMPKPYNDQSQYGICPCWGYGEVLESQVSGIEVGTLLWGYWPTSSLPVDLQLIPGEALGQWIETTKTRQVLKPLYNRYFVLDSTMRLEGLDQHTLDSMGWEAVCRPVWECGYLLNNYILAAPAVHPTGRDGTTPWSSEDADIRKAVVINLSAAGKTARAFADALINDREAGTGPLALLAITAGNVHTLMPKASFPTKTVSYGAMSNNETLSWIAHQKPSKIVICDFGGRGDSYEALLQALEKHLADVRITTIGIGAEAKPFSPKEVGEWMQRMARPSRIQMSTSDVRDEAVSQRGPEQYYHEYTEAWKAFVNRGNLDGMRLVWGNGVKGKDGIEGGWDHICQGTVPSNIGLVYRL